MIFRRAFLALLAYLALCPAAFAQQTSPAAADSGTWRHGLSLFGDVKYPADFAYFDYVNPQAPKGGTLRLSALGTFDSFNTVIPRGIAPGDLGRIYDTLTTSSQDEPSTQYGLIADGARYPDDFSSVTYRLRPEARWHDGQPITPDDVIWSFEKLKELAPLYAYYFRNVAKAEKTGEHEVTFTFDQSGNRELPQIVGQLPVLPKHWWEGTDAQGRKRDISQTTLEPPLGSGAYRIADVTPGRSITYERVADYWGRDLPVNVGSNNFDVVRTEYYRDADVALEAFKAGQYDYRMENVAKNWATAYDFPARNDGRVVLDAFPVKNSGIMQAFVFNLRRAKFQDARVRRAFNLAMNFEEMNRTFFYGQYARIGSFFQNTELAATGLPQGRELAILNEVRDAVPPEVFTTAYSNPVNGDANAVRDNLREAARLLKEAGWSVQQVGGRRVLANAQGEAFSVEFLISQPAFERVALFYKQALDRLGFDVQVRSVDSAQYENRVNARDFDVIWDGWGQSLSPGNEQREYWGSASAERDGSRNLAGIQNAAVDRLIEKVVFATDREELVAATHALDRVLLWNNYVVPQWTTTSTRFAYWKRFAHPPILPAYSSNGGFPDIWWFDPSGAANQPAPAAPPK